MDYGKDVIQLEQRMAELAAGGAVSYTHLDVYKRQILFCADCGSVMYQQRYQTDKRKQDCYICGNYKKRTHDCTTHFILSLIHI